MITKAPLNWAMVRQAINSGKTREKVKGFDPAAAPLGTDDEAAGVPTQPMAMDAEPRFGRKR